MLRLTANEVCDMYKISATTLKRWADTDNIVCQKISSKKFLYHIPESDIDYLENAARIPVFIPDKFTGFSLQDIMYKINDSYHQIYPDHDLTDFQYDNGDGCIKICNEPDKWADMKAVIIVGNVSDFLRSLEITKLLDFAVSKRIPIWTYSPELESFEKYEEIRDFFAMEDECGRTEVIRVPWDHKWECAYKRPYFKAKFIKVTNGFEKCEVLDEVSYLNPDILQLSPEQKKIYDKICEYHDIIVIEK